ncbi:diguanylate cyclase [Magnetococcales bacterium HHB-1]
MSLWRLHNWPILSKILFISFFGTSLILAVTFIYFIPYVKNRVMEEKKATTKKVVEVAFGILQRHHFLETSGALSRENAQKQAMETVKLLRYQEYEYFWINDNTPRMVMHPIIASLDGKDLTNYKDPNGVLLFQEFVKKAKKKNGGFVGYMWPKPEEETPVPKVSYVKGFKPWGWIIGSGIYLDDVEKEVNELQTTVIRGALLFSLIILILAYWTGHSITRRLKSVIAGLKEISQGAGDVDLHHKININSTDEIGSLCIEFNFLMESINRLTKFRKVIEEDETKEDVYSRLWSVFTEFLDFKEIVIYEINNTNDQMQVVYPLSIKENELRCNPAILSNCNLCKVKRTGHKISSYDFPKICKQFQEGEEIQQYVCLPMNISGITIGVTQFVVNGDADIKRADQTMIKVRQAIQYIHEALPIIESKHLTTTLRESAQRDPLTGLHNRRYLQESAERICAATLRRKKSIGILMCDMDFFKQVNDEHGHDAGDAILRQTATLLNDSIRTADLVFRFGGEEFMIMLIDIEKDEAIQLAEKLRQKIEQNKFSIPNGPSLEKTISVGVSTFPDDDTSFWKTLKYSDVALYQAKEQGRNLVVRFNHDMWDNAQY